MDFTSGAFWAAFASIILANVVLSGDNAVVIAMAARSLPADQQKKAIVWGSAAAIVMRILLTVAAVELLRWPYLKVVGAMLLLYVGITLLSQEGDAGEGQQHAGTVFAAIRTILVADLVMSLDNVLAVAAAADGNKPLLAAGLVVSIPLIALGSTLLLKFMERFPVVITCGAAMLGFLAGEMLLTDPAVTERVGELPQAVIQATGAVGAGIVVASGLWLQRRGLAGNAEA